MPTLTKVASGLSCLLAAASLASTTTGAITSATTSSMTSVAAAAELTPNCYGGPTPYFAFSWAGPYVGATLCYEWGSIDNNPTRPNGVAGGFEAGFNWQNGNFIYGGEADISFSAASDTFAPWQFSNPRFGMARGRAGIAVNYALLFDTAGLAYGELTGTSSGNLSESHTSLGWARVCVFINLSPRSPNGLAGLAIIWFFNSDENDVESRSKAAQFEHGH